MIHITRIQILQHAQGVILDKCTIIAANQDVVFNSMNNKYILSGADLQILANHETGLSMGKFHYKLHTYGMNWANSSTDKYKQWLTPPDTSTNLNNALKNHLSNTGSWLLNSSAYLEWKQRDNSFLWIHGICKCNIRFQYFSNHFCSWLRENYSLVSLLHLLLYHVTPSKFHFDSSHSKTD